MLWIWFDHTVFPKEIERVISWLDNTVFIRGIDFHNMIIVHSVYKENHDEISTVFTKEIDCVTTVDYIVFTMEIYHVLTWSDSTVFTNDIYCYNMIRLHGIWKYRAI